MAVRTYARPELQGETHCQAGRMVGAPGAAPKQGVLAAPDWGVRGQAALRGQEGGARARFNALYEHALEGIAAQRQPRNSGRCCGTSALLAAPPARREERAPQGEACEGPAAAAAVERLRPAESKRPVRTMGSGSDPFHLVVGAGHARLATTRGQSTRASTARTPALRGCCGLRAALTQPRRTTRVSATLELHQLAGAPAPLEPKLGALDVPLAAAPAPIWMLDLRCSSAAWICSAWWALSASGL